MFPIFCSSLNPYRLQARSVATAIRQATASPRRFYASASTVNDLPESRLNPQPDDYSSPSFADKAELTLYAGKGGNGCISFLREAYFPDGPANGGDGGHGGNVYIQAAHGETSLHKLSRRRFVRAGRGKHGQGSAKGGSRGDDVVITVPVGTIVREITREDPAAEEVESIRAWNLMLKERKREERMAEEARERNRIALTQDGAEDILEEELLQQEQQEKEKEKEEEEFDMQNPQREKWLLYPGMSKNDMKSESFPKLPRRTRLFHQPPSSVYLDLSRPTPKPILLATGGVGGLGNPHFTSMKHARPMFATKGDEAVTMKIELELKLLADVGLVGLPNAGKSTLVRAISNSRSRVGNWAFTTLQPNIGTVVLDKYTGRPTSKTYRRYPAQGGMEEVVELEPRTRFTVADIPGLIEGAHLDRGLGIAFLRHVERARVLAFVIDLSAGNAVKALKALWKEVGLYARMREEEAEDRDVDSRVDWDIASHNPSNGTVNLMDESLLDSVPDDAIAPTMAIAGKPWFVVATKADLPETKDNFQELKQYLEQVTEGAETHPSGVEGGWTKRVTGIPVSAINGHGVQHIVNWTVGLLDE